MDLSRHSYFRQAAIFGLIFIAYLSTGVISLKLASLNASTSPFWAPSGVAIASIFLFGYRFFPAIYLGAFATNLTTAMPLAGVMAIAMGNTLEALTCVWLMHSLLRRSSLGVYTEFFAFIVGSVVGSLISASVGTGALVSTGTINTAAVPYTMLTWWSGDLVGAVVFCPFLVAIFSSKIRPPKFSKIIEFFVYATVNFYVTRNVFFDYWQEGSYWITCLFLLVTRRRLGSLAAFFMVAVCSLLAVHFTYAGYGPFEFGSRNLNLLYLQSILVTFSFFASFIDILFRQVLSRAVSAVLVGGIILVVFSVNRIADEENLHKQSEFNALAQQAISGLKKAEDRYSMLLMSGAGFISVYPDADQEKWRRYTTTLDIPINYGAINGFGVVGIIPKKSIHRGVPIKILDPIYASRYRDSFPIRFVEPLNRNGPAVGLDLGSEPSRRLAAELARSKKAAVATTPIRLVQDDYKRARIFDLLPYHFGGPFFGMDLRSCNIGGFF